MTFGGIEPEYAGFEKALFVVLPVPYDLTSTYRSGSRLGPAAILDASANMELYDEELGRETYRRGIHTLPFLEVDARGPKEMIESIRQKTLDVVQAGKIPVTLGGEHSVSFGCVQALKRNIRRCPCSSSMPTPICGTPIRAALTVMPPWPGGFRKAVRLSKQASGA